MAESSRVELVVEAKDNASRTFQSVRRELEQLPAAARNVEALGATVARTSGGMADWDRTMQGVRSELAGLQASITGLSPALTQAATGITTLTQANTELVGGLSNLRLGILSVAAVIGTELAQAYQKAAQEQRAFELAMRSFDGGRIAGEIKKIREEMQGLQFDEEQRGGSLFGQRGMFRSPLDPFFNFQDRRRLETLRGREQRALEEAEAARVAELETQGYAANAARDELVAGQRALRRFEEERAAAAAEERRRLDLQRRRFADFARAASAFDESRAFAVDISPDALERQETISLRARQRTPEYIRQREADLRAAEAAGDESLAFRARLSPRQEEAITRGASAGLLQIERQRLDVERDRIELLSRMPALTEQERDALGELVARQRELVELKRLEAEIDAAQRIVDDEKIATDADRARLESLKEQRDLKLQIAALDQQARARELAERYDPTAGALRGLQDFEDIAQRQGERFRVALFDSLQTVSGGITEILVQGISGDLDRIGDIGKQMGQALMRGLLQELVVTPLVSALGGALRGAIGSLTGGGLGTATAAGGGGLLALLGLGGTAQAAVGTAPNLPVGSLVQTAAGTGVVTASGAVVLTGAGAGVGAVGAGNDLVASAAAGASPFGGSTSAVLTSSQAAVGGGTSATSAILGGAAGVAAVGLTAYSASQYATSTQDVAFAGVTGALSGAAAGAAIGGYFGESGYGALIGAVAGAAVSAGAAVYGKRNNRPSRAEREQQEVSGVAASFQPMFADLDAAQTPDELYAVVKRYTHAGRGGERQARGPEDAGLVVSVSVAGTVRRVIDEGVTPEQLVQYGDTATVTIFVGVAPEVKAPFEERLANAIRQAAQRIRGLGDQVRLFFEDRIGGGITKTTVLAYSRLAEAAGQEISVVASTLNGLDPEVRAKILERIAQQDVNGALDLYAVESNLNKVKVGEYLRAALSAPGTPGGPAVPNRPLTPDEQAAVDDFLEQARTIPGGLDAIVQDALDQAINDAQQEDPQGLEGMTGNLTDTGFVVGIGNTNFHVDVDPTGIAGQSIAAAGGNTGGPRIAGLAVDTALAIGGKFNPIVAVISTVNNLVGTAKSAAQGKGFNPARLPITITTTPRTFGPHATRPRGADVDPPDASGGSPTGAPPGPEAGQPGLGLDVGPVGAPGSGGAPSAGGQPGSTSGDVGSVTAEGTNAAGGQESAGGPGAEGDGASSGGGSGGGGVGDGTGPGDAGDSDGGFAEGGWVKGDPRHGDVMPARVGRRGRPIRLTGREFVTNPMSAAEHAEELEDINLRVPGRFPAREESLDSWLRRVRANPTALRILGQLLHTENQKGDLGWFQTRRGPITPAWETF